MSPLPIQPQGHQVHFSTLHFLASPDLTPPSKLLSLHPLKCDLRAPQPAQYSPKAPLGFCVPALTARPQPTSPAPGLLAPRPPSAPQSAASQVALAGARAGAEAGTARPPAEPHPPDWQAAVAAAAAAVCRGSGSTSYSRLGPADVSSATVPASHRPGPQRGRSNHCPQTPWPGVRPQPPNPARSASAPPRA